MRVRTLAVLLPAAAFAVLASLAGCKSKGNGLGTAPPEQVCPAGTPSEGSSCPGVLICDYPGTCPDGGVGYGSVMVCNGGGDATWTCYQLSDASLPEGGTKDGGSDADAADGEAGDAADAGDATDAGDAADAGDATDAADATDATDAADVSDAADATDTAPDAVADTGDADDAGADAADAADTD